MKRRLVSSVLLLVPLTYFDGPYDCGTAVAEFFEGNHIAMGLVQSLLLTIAVMVINQKFFISLSLQSLWHKAPNMSIVALVRTVSFGIQRLRPVCHDGSAGTGGH